MALSIRERIEEEIARKVAAVTGLAAERWNGLRGQSSSTVDTTVVTVSAGEEENSNEAAGGSGAVTVYTLTVDMTCEIVQPETDTTPTATRVNAVVSEILAAVLADPNLTETATGAPGEPLAIDTEYRSVEGPIADERAEGSSFVNISVDVTYQTFRDDPTTAPGISERT